MYAGDRAAWLVQPDISIALQRVLLELLKPCWAPTPNQYRRTSYCHVWQDSPGIIWTLKQRKEQFNCQNSWQSQADERFSRRNPDLTFQVVCLKHVVKVVISNHSSTKASERSPSRERGHKGRQFHVSFISKGKQWKKLKLTEKLKCYLRLEISRIFIRKYQLPSKRKVYNCGNYTENYTTNLFRLTINLWL